MPLHLHRFYSVLMFDEHRKIGKAVHPMVVVNWLSIMGILVPILPIAFYEGFVLPHGTQWLLLLALGVVGFLAQSLFISFSYSCIDDRRVFTHVCVCVV